mmetsp:Transcript_19969/g.29589  ORF Transcript_19969/g.29589 Transcript_19969/m.29589 type:complete len:229 (-) Transcript_19969:594-1280(-)
MMALLNTLTAIVLWLAITTLLPLLFTPLDPTNWITLSLLIFNNLNTLISMCEIVLGFRIDLIKKNYLKLREKYKGKEVEGCLAYLFMPLPNPFDSAAWSNMWSTYSLYDPSYQNQESFGFFIDVGNGFSTIPPCLLWNYAMAYPASVSPLLVGCVGVASYWQICYGTIIYLLSFAFNRRYEGRTIAEVAGFVGFVNLLWFFFPLMGIYASVIILRDSNFDVFQPTTSA